VVLSGVVQFVVVDTVNIRAAVVNPQKYVVPHCPSPLKHCHGSRRDALQGLHVPHVGEMRSNRSLLVQSLGCLHAKHAPPFTKNPLLHCHCEHPTTQYAFSGIGSQDTHVVSAAIVHGVETRIPAEQTEHETQKASAVFVQAIRYDTPAVHCGVEHSEQPTGLPNTSRPYVGSMNAPALHVTLHVFGPFLVPFDVKTPFATELVHCMQQGHWPLSPHTVAL
jgi:hypothetical protein